MTTYQGGKKRIGKRIHQVIDIIEENLYPDDKLSIYYNKYNNYIYYIYYNKHARFRKLY